MMIDEETFSQIQRCSFKLYTTFEMTCQQFWYTTADSIWCNSFM